MRQLLEHLRTSGVPAVSIEHLTAALTAPGLRDGINPVFEPLSFPRIEAGLVELIHEGAVIEEAGLLRLES